MNVHKVLNVILMFVIIALLFSLTSGQGDSSENPDAEAYEVYWIPVTAPDGENARCYGKAWQDNSIFGGGALIIYTGHSAAFVCFEGE